jgi:hypothetical protein
VIRIVRTIVGAVIGVIGGIVKAVKDALAWLGKLVASMNKMPVMPGIEDYGKGHAEGGWVGLHGPELAMVGEKGPEYIIPNHKLPSGGGGGTGGGGTFVAVPLSQTELENAVDRGLYFKLRRSAPTLARS